MFRAILTAASFAALGSSAWAYEYPLQDPGVPVGQVYYRHIAGYAIVGATVTGDCTEFSSTACSGRGCHPNRYFYYRGCAWDFHGSLLGTTTGEPTAPPPISTANGLVTYAANGQGVSTGAAGSTGFVIAPSAQYAWVAPQPYVFLPADRPYPIALTLQNLGDLPLVVTNVTFANTLPLASLSVRRTTCLAGPVAPTKTCRLVVTYNPTKLPKGDNPYTAYDQVAVAVVSNSGQSPALGFTAETPIPVIP